MFFKLSNGTEVNWPLENKGWFKTSEGFESKQYKKRKMMMRVVIAILLVALCYVGYRWYLCEKK